MLQQLLSPSRSQSTNPEEFDRIVRSGYLASNGRARALLLSRALYRTRLFSLATVPRADRVGAIRHLLEAWAPFDDAGYCVGWLGDQALAFAWDRRLLADSLSAAGIAPDRLVVPEGLHRAALQDGVRLHACLEGYEAQAWSGGRLRDSQWWSSWPNEMQWQAFLRVAGMPGESADGEVIGPASVDAQTPWVVRRWLDCVPSGQLTRTGADWERWLILGVGCCLAGFAGAQLHLAYAGHRQLREAQAEQASLQARMQPVAALRSDALAAAARANGLAAALTGPQPIEVMKHLVESLPTTGVTMQDFLLQGDQLRVSLKLAPEIQRSAVIKQLQSGGWFADVNESREALVPTAVTFTMRLRSDPGTAVATATKASAAGDAASAVPGRGN